MNHTSCFWEHKITSGGSGTAADSNDLAWLDIFKCQNAVWKELAEMFKSVGKGF
jgi:hypothetical protein